MKSKEAIKHLEIMEGLAWRCICHVHYFHLMSGHQGKFWPIVQNAIGEGACLFWSHLFGSRNDDFHYSNLFSLEEVEQTDIKFSLNKVKARLLNRVGMKDPEYEYFWKDVKSCRDQFIAHRDSKGMCIIFPRIDLCREMAEELRDIFYEIVCVWLGEFQNDSKLEGLKEYYEWNTNRSFVSKCKHEFEVGITDLSKTFG